MRNCPLCNHKKNHTKFVVDNYKIGRCKNCGFVFLENPIDLDNEAKNYEEYFASAQHSEYASNSSDKEMIKTWRFNEQRLTWLKSPKPNGRLLDIGCGRGYFLYHAQQAGYTVEGVDISLSASRFASEEFGLKVHLCNLEKEILIEGQYDIITLWHVLEHFQNPRIVMENVWNLLKSEGKIYIQVPNSHSLKFLLSPSSKRWKGGNHPKYHRSFFTSGSLLLLLSYTGFTNIKFIHPDYKKMSLPFINVCKKLLDQFKLGPFLTIMAQNQ